MRCQMSEIRKWKRMEDEECCGGDCYDPEIEGCCPSMSYTFEVYNLETQECCGGNVIDKCDPDECEECDGEGACEVCNGDPDQACCDGTCYDKATKGCCDGVIYDKETECCYQGEIKDCCKDESTGNCEAQHDICGCDPEGAGASCADKMHKYPLGSTHFCYSECGGEPCNYSLTEIPCYAYKGCTQSTRHWVNKCGECGDLPEECHYDYCVGTILPMFCDECIADPAQDYTIVEAYDCRCP